MTTKKKRRLALTVSILIIVVTVSTLALNIYASASGAVLVPVVATTVIGLLITAGVLSAGSTNDSIFPNQGNPYMSQIVEDIKFVSSTSGLGFATEVLNRLLPDGLYYTDGAGNYYIGSDPATAVPVTPENFYVKTSAAVNTSYDLPLNIESIADLASLYSFTTQTEPYYLYVADVSDFFASAGSYSLVPYAKCMPNLGVGEPYIICSSRYARQTGLSELTFSDWNAAPGLSYPSSVYSYSTPGNYTGGQIYCNVVGGGAAVWAASSQWTILPANDNHRGGVDLTRSFISSWNSNSIWMPYTYDNISYFFGSSSSSGYGGAIPVDRILATTYAITAGVPVRTLAEQYPALVEDKDALDDTVVKVPDPPPDDDDDTVFFPVPPSFWDIFETVMDVLDRPSNWPAGNGSNTDLGQFIDNGFVYNDIDINLPEIPDYFTVEIRGGLKLDIDADINLGGNININVDIHDDVDLPEITSSDGEGLIDMGVADVVGGLTTHNPVMATLKSLFGSIDPTLAALFISAVSLSILIGLWKLIRG